jgi:cell division transport system permease protein
MARRPRQAPADGARRRRTRVADRWRGWQRHHSLSAADSLARVLQHPLASAVTWLVIGVAIALPAGLWLVLENAASVGERLESPAQLSVFLDRAVSLEEAGVLAEALRGEPGVAAVQLLPRAQALEEFVARSGLGELAASLPDNPLPHLLLLTPAAQDGAAVDALATELAAREQVDEVVLDTQWLTRLQRLMDLGRRAVQVLGVLLLGAVVLVLGNTIRLAIESRRDEIEVIKLVGGSDAFVRRPLLYTGLWYGLGGGMVAALLLALAVRLLAGPVAAVAAAYGSDMRLSGLGLVDSLQLVLIGGALGLAGAWLAVARHLREVRPGAL